MATFEKGILGGFSGKVGNVVGARWRGRNVMRSLPQRGNYTPTEEQLIQREKFRVVVEFLNPIKGVLSALFGKKQGDKSAYNLATSYHLKEALIDINNVYMIDYPKVLISKGDLRGIDSGAIAAGANQLLSVTWSNNSGQGNANALDYLVVVVFSPDLNLFQVFDPAGVREDGEAQLSLPAFFGGLEVQCWATFATDTGKLAAVSSYLGAVTVS